MTSCDRKYVKGFYLKNIENYKPESIAISISIKYIYDLK